MMERNRFDVAIVIQVFSQKENLKRHCDSSFAKKISLNKHIKAVHEERKLPIQKKWFLTNKGIMFLRY